MLKPDPPGEGRSLVVSPHPIEVVLFEDGVSPLALTLPPFEDMAEMRSLSTANFSIHEVGHARRAGLLQVHLHELQDLLRQKQRFASSVTFWNRLANLAAVNGDFDTEAEYLHAASEISADEFVLNRLGENLVARDRPKDAEHFFAGLELGTNVHANLRLAAFHVGRHELTLAEERVTRALSIDPFDYSARLFDGSLKLFRSRPEEAVLSLKIAIEERPNSATAHANLAVAYLLLGRADRALQSLRRAVALDPLNESTVALLADVSHARGTAEDAVPSLRYLIRFEQKSSGMWARLARALIAIKEYNEAIAALKRQGSVEDNSEVWNNLGVAYYFKNDAERALQSFKHAMTLSRGARDVAYCIAAKNAAAVMQKNRSAEETLRFVSQVIVRENEALVCGDKVLSQLFLIQLNALVKARRVEDAVKLGLDLVARADSNEELRGWVVVGLLAHYALNREYGARAIKLAEEWAPKLREIQSKELRVQLTNNIAFVYAEAGQLDVADAYLRLLSGSIHKEAYPTATLGLVHLRKGHIERGDELYREALGLCHDAVDKARIRQKWNFEMGKLLLVAEPVRAVKFLQKAATEKEGERPVAEAASSILLSLPSARPKP